MDIGTGLAILGIGLPAAVALLIPVVELMPERRQVAVCPIREHEARMAEYEKSVARLEENMAAIKATLLRIETKMEVRHGKD
jgi:hypothetical protein